MSSVKLEMLLKHFYVYTFIVYYVVFLAVTQKKEPNSY